MEIGLSSFIHESNLKMALKLIRDGVDINGRYEYGTRPIVAAINSCKIETLRFVVEQGANVNIDYWLPYKIND